MELCPCKSGNSYSACCQKYHQGWLPENALILMRSRYAAYALGLIEYIMCTTHPLHPAKKKAPRKWRQEILDFSTKTTFSHLTILDFIDGANEAFVTFKAELSQNGKDCSFTEKSRFLKEKGRWLYVEGVFVKSI